jgi:hypothetical protein
MIEEIGKLGEINSINDFFDFKFTVKTLIIIGFIYSILASIVVVFLFGGVNNTMDYITDIIETTKQKIILKGKKKGGEKEIVREENSVTN